MHCISSLSKTLYPLLRTGSTQEDPSATEFSLMHKILHFGAFSIKMTPKKLISVSSMMQLKKKSLVSFLNSEVVLSKRITRFPLLIIASFINNVPIPTHVLHQTPRLRCLLEYLLGRKTARQLGDAILWEFKMLHP